MQTHFSIDQLSDPDTSAVNDILRSCVHCGFCTATCPTYVLLGDELDSPRGRIYLMKEMLESEEPATKEVVTHIDRCLSCLSCMTTCPSAVHYQHLVDHGRSYIEDTYKRPFLDRLVRWSLSMTIPYPSRFRMAIWLAILFRPVRFLFPKYFRTMIDLAPISLTKKSTTDFQGIYQSQGTKNIRVALLSGCAQTVLSPQINESTVRVLTRLGAEVVVSKNSGCCGSLVHHLGKADLSRQQAKANIDSWWLEIQRGELDAIVVNTSGCGTQIKDYAFMFRDEPEYALKAEKISKLACDISEFLHSLDIEFVKNDEIQKSKVTYHSACSMQHGQGIKNQPKELLEAAGFLVSEPEEGHLCCGSAGTYNILQNELAEKLRVRKTEKICATNPDFVATGNIGCITQLVRGLDIPIVHTIELLDWATGGPKPSELENKR